jgi:hypothetical protein
VASNDLSNALDDCLRQIASGRTVDQAVSQYPQFEPALRVMLAASAVVPRYTLPEDEVFAARERLLPEIDRLIDRLPMRRRPPPWLPLALLSLILGGVLIGILFRGDDIVPLPQASATLVDMRLVTEAATIDATLLVTPLPPTPASVCSERLVVEGVIESINGQIVTLYHLRVRLSDVSGLSVGSWIRAEGCICDDDDDCGEENARATVISTPTVQASPLPVSPGSVPPPLTGSDAGAGDDDDDAGDDAADDDGGGDDDG